MKICVVVRLSESGKPLSGKKFSNFFSKFFPKFSKKISKKVGRPFKGLDKMQFWWNFIKMLLRHIYYGVFFLFQIYLIGGAREQISKKTKKTCFSAQNNFFSILKIKTPKMFKNNHFGLCQKKFMIKVTFAHFFLKKISESFFEPCNHYFNKPITQKCCFLCKSHDIWINFELYVTWA